MKPLPKISEAEYEVMKIIWSHAPINTNEITQHLTRTTDWSPKTIQTLIKRLVNKGVLTYEKQSRVFVYTPLFSQKDYIGQESHSFLDRFYNGKDDLHADCLSGQRPVNGYRNRYPADAPFPKPPKRRPLI